MKHKIDDNLFHIIQFVEEHCQELVLECHEMVRLMGISSCKDDDYYWVIMDYRGETKLSSCVGTLWPLKGILPKEQYQYLNYFFHINNIFTDDKERDELHRIQNKEVKASA